MRNVAQVLPRVSAMAEGIFELAVTVAPEHVGQRLANFGAGRDSLREDGLGVGDIEG